MEGGRPVRTTPFPSWPVFDESDVEAVAIVLRSGVWGSAGGQGAVADFERAFAAYHSARHAMCLVNGTQALRVALLAAGVGEGDEVIVPPYTFIATASAVLEAGAIPVFVDIDAATFNLDPGLIEAAITPRTKSIIPVHFGGLAVDMDRVMEIADRHGLIVIEDAAHAHGAEWRGRRLGTIGHFGCFSCQSSKNLNAGEGGIILTQDDALGARARSILHCGRVDGGGWYEHATLGSNLRLTEMQGALLLSQLKRVEEQTVRRDENGRYLDSLLNRIPGIRPQTRLDGHTRCSYHLYLFRYSADAFGNRPRADFLKALRAEGIPASPGYSIPLYRQPVLAHNQFGPSLRTYATQLDYSSLNLANSEEACAATAVWFTQNVLLADRAAMDDIARSIAKIQAKWGAAPIGA
jgi:dTDP-4-amino-4,6-dideoxygalactose transaminase